MRCSNSHSFIIWKQTQNYATHEINVTVKLLRERLCIVHVGLLIFLLCLVELFVRHDREEPRGILILAFYSLDFWFSMQKTGGGGAYLYFGLPLKATVFPGCLLSFSLFFLLSSVLSHFQRMQGQCSEEHIQHPSSRLLSMRYSGKKKKKKMPFSCEISAKTFKKKTKKNPCTSKTGKVSPGEPKWLWRSGLLIIIKYSSRKRPFLIS